MSSSIYYDVFNRRWLAVNKPLGGICLTIFNSSYLSLGTKINNWVCQLKFDSI